MSRKFKAIIGAGVLALVVAVWAFTASFKVRVSPRTPTTAQAGETPAPPAADLPSAQPADPPLDPLLVQRMAAWTEDMTRAGDTITWPYGGDPAQLRVDLPPRDCTRGFVSDVYGKFLFARWKSGMDSETAPLCTVHAFDAAGHEIGISSSETRKYPGGMMTLDEMARSDRWRQEAPAIIAAARHDLCYGTPIGYYGPPASAAEQAECERRAEALVVSWARNDEDHMNVTFTDPTSERRAAATVMMERTGDGEWHGRHF